MSLSAMVASKTLGEGLLDRIGNTPLLRLDGITKHLPESRFLAKRSGRTQADR